ncbi:alpha-hydroxy-acid oxidizing protein [Acidovorax sp. SUPP2522]|uniref:alpha-hydroxy acid oxidase n=1 Tax=unclassified Acidovorax TaxID=2684926 RepID=UPI002349717A|nr:MULTISPECIES: alpha-hydroxy acid oxidase [unclassified Acidovorax]WCM99637.1 alpha-hydroxy-acid oxidizing protein [Acidovorax sp. GBBC 1281]GKT19064.1 alpha-hydroxy-acid oxidizing protein [Acidovorax sp. SUPP2522]
MHSRLASVLALKDFEPLARRILPRPIYGYVEGAAEDNRSLSANRTAMDAWSLVPRVLVNVSARTQQQQIFGVTYASPFGIAPMGLAALSCYRGDIALARAAREANIPAVLSGSSLTPLEAVAEAAPGTWFQAYLPGDIGRILSLLERVRRAGYETLVITVDIPVGANRENNIRTGFSTPLKPSVRLAIDGLTRPQWLLGTFARTFLRDGMPHFENSFAERGAPILSRNVLRDFSARDHLDWSHIARIRSAWRGSLVLKGILSADDMAHAVKAGVDGVIVSNHGGRQLDCAVAPMLVLERIIDAAGSLAVMVDGGFRRGSDVLKALALGARFAFIGRPFNYAAAVAGGEGVAHAIQLLRYEVDRNMAMLGVNCCDDMTRTRLLPLVK